jgi:hypothetical protein
MNAGLGWFVTAHAAGRFRQGPGWSERLCVRHAAKPASVRAAACASCCLLGYTADYATSDDRDRLLWPNTVMLSMRQSAKRGILKAAARDS